MASAQPSKGILWWLFRLRGVIYTAVLGLVSFFDFLGTRMKVFGVICEIGAVFFGIRAFRIERQRRTASEAPGPAPYADLQAAMAHLHEVEDKAHPKRFKASE
jgi:hypothetical protein